MSSPEIAARTRVDPGGLVGVLGIAIPTIGLIVLPIWRFPATGSSAAQVVSFAARHRTAVEVTMLSNAVGVTLWGVFGVHVWMRLRRVLEPESSLPACFIAGVVGFVTLLLSGFASIDAAFYQRVDAAESRVLYDLCFALLAMSGLPTAVALIAFATALYRTRFLPIAVGHLAVVTAVGHVLLMLSFVVDRGFFSLEGAVITVIPALLWAWILVTSIAMLNRQPR